MSGWGVAGCDGSRTRFPGNVAAWGGSVALGFMLGMTPVDGQVPRRTPGRPSRHTDNRHGGICGSVYRERLFFSRVDARVAGGNCRHLRAQSECQFFDRVIGRHAGLRSPGTRPRAPADTLRQAIASSLRWSFSFLPRKRPVSQTLKQRAESQFRFRRLKMLVS